MNKNLFLTLKKKSWNLYGRAVDDMLEDKNIVPLKVAISATFLLYWYKFLVQANDKNNNLFRLPIRYASNRRVSLYTN